MSNNNSGCGTVLLIGAILIGLYLLIIFLVWLSKILLGFFTYLGFNIFFFIDNLFAIDPFNPILVWGFWGLLIGSILGIYLAIKKLNLNYKIIFFPIILVFLLILIMGIVNKPTDYDVIVSPITETTNTNSTKSNIYITNSKTSVYSSISKKQSVLFKLDKGLSVAVLETGLYDSKNIEWYKIEYENKQGFVKSEYLNIQNKNQNNENSNSSNNDNTSNAPQPNLYTPDGVVVKFINALGSQDFSAAFALMTEKRRGSYSNFSSTKGYGGITSTRIFSCSYTNKVNQKYEVYVEYEAIDPANKSGKFKQYFYLIPFNDSYLISEIKNSDIEWY